MSYKLDLETHLAIITLNNDFTIFYNRDLLAEMDRLRERKLRFVVFNLFNAAWMDSVGVGCIVKAGQLSEPFGKKAILINANEKIRFVLDQLDIKNYFDYALSLDKAREVLA